MLLSKEVNIVLSGKNIKHFENLGYYIPRVKKNNNRFVVEQGTTIIVNVKDLQESSHAKIDILCDYCNKTIISKSYKDYYFNIKNRIINKDCCDNCRSIKIKESNLLIYNVENISQLSDIKDKKIQTCLNNYGVEHPLQNREIFNKAQNTIVEKYGSLNYWNNQEIINKKNRTNISKYGLINQQSAQLTIENRKANNKIKYGVENTFQVEDIQNKIRYTFQMKYGGNSPFCNTDIIEKRNKSLYKNKNAPSSKQQEYLSIIYHGELNYPEKYYILDIAFPFEKIYLEYDGSGHDLQVRYGSISKEKFIEKEIKRGYSLSKLGWKKVTFKSKKDYLPNDMVLYKIFEIAREYLKLGHTWFEINIDESKLKCSQYEINYDFGKLRKIS